MTATETPQSVATVPRRRPHLAVVAGVTSAVANALVLVAGVLVRPMYDRGEGQRAGGYVNAVVQLWRAPGDWLAEQFLTQVYHHPYLKFWAVALAIDVVLYAALIAAVIGVYRSVRPAPRRPSEPVDEPPGALPSRRQFIRGGLSASVASVAAGIGGYSVFVEPRAYRVGRYTIPIPDLPPSLDGLLVAHLTDIHHGPWLPLPHVRDIVRTTNALDPDLIVLTGDYVLDSPVYAGPVVSALADLRARSGVVAVLGNHDWAEDGPLIRRCLTNVAIPTLDNARLVLTPDRRLVAEAADGLAVAGVGDLWMDRQLYHAALGGLPADMPRLLLSHNPDVAEDLAFLAAGYRVDLMLCGHLHGGQVRLPFVGSPWAPSRFGDKYARGLVDGPTTRVFTSPGLGMTGLPVRLGATPEISLLRLVRPAPGA